MQIPQTLIEPITIAVLTLSSLLFFSCLEYSLRKKNKITKVFLLNCATVFGCIVFECVMRLWLQNIRQEYLGFGIHTLLRISQVLFMFIGFLISILILFPKRDTAEIQE